MTEKNTPEERCARCDGLLDVKWIAMGLEYFGCECGTTMRRDWSGSLWGRVAPAPLADAVQTADNASNVRLPLADGVFAQIERDGHFAEELTALLNRYSQENASNTPDFILCGYIVACLAAFNEASRARETWYGKSLHI